jgi:hypothetical protein
MNYRVDFYSYCIHTWAMNILLRVTGNLARLYIPFMDSINYTGIVLR